LIKENINILFIGILYLLVVGHMTKQMKQLLVEHSNMLFFR